MPPSYALKLYLLWQGVILFFSLLAVIFLPYKQGYLGLGTRQYLTNPVLYAKGNYDGVHYQLIAKRGYSSHEVAFFPFYPTLMRLLTGILPSPFWAGIVVSNLAFLLGLVVLTKLLSLDFSPHVVFWTLAALLIFPVSFFFSAIYTESLFFLLVVAAFYAARTHRWLVACILGALATYTRFVGIFLFPVLAVELWFQYPSLMKYWSKYLLLLIIPLGLLYYMSFLKTSFSDPLAFLHSLPTFGEFRSNKIILLYQVFWRYTKMLATFKSSDPIYLTITLEFLVGLVFMITSFLSFLRHRFSYALFNFLLYLVPTLTGSFVSLPRYVLICFPTFLLIGNFLAAHPRARPYILGGFSLLSLLFTSLFVRGFWVA